jgi:paraquat-inducible protein A
MSIIVCHACDLVHRRSEVAAERTRVRCVRCRAELYRTHSTSLDTAIAVALSSLVLLVLSNAYPMVTLELNGSKRTATLLRAVWDMYLQGYVPVALLVLLTTVLLYLLISLRRGRTGNTAPPIAGRNELFRALGRLRPWSMSEVFMLGALVAMVKLSAMASVVPGISLFSYGALMLMLAALTAITSPEQFWRWVEESGS